MLIVRNSAKSRITAGRKSDMRKRLILTTGLTIACTTLGALLLPVGAAHADYEPNAHDVVGIGSTALQFVMDFSADGDPSGDTGYNSSDNMYKLVSLDGTADSNGRPSFANGGLPLDPTVVFRAETYPIQRIASS